MGGIVKRVAVAVVLLVLLGCGSSEDEAADLAEADRDSWACFTQMNALKQAIDNYRLSNKRLPDSLQRLTETDSRSRYPFLKSIPKDPWGNEYEYRVSDLNRYQMRSYGADGLRDSADDVHYPDGP